MAHQAAIRPTDEAGLARRPSGVIVPAALASQPDDGAKGQTGSVARDMDGRRRVVFGNEERRAIDKAIKLLQAQGIGSLIGCVGGYGKTGRPGYGHHRDGSVACGQPLRPEGSDGPDAGYGCNCTRVHFLRR